jgi:hypothetical protein
MRTRLSIALLALSPFATALAQGTSAAPRAQTVNGTVVGTTLPSGVKAFRGVPFADAPVRENRWRPPQPVKNWTGIRQADRFADQCMQGRIFGDMMFRNSGVSEDCLYLNVWVPPTAKAGENLPVLVYYYGGGFVAGDGSEPRYDGESMAKRGIVVVTTSYRLGIFGFFSHPELTAESPNHASGNYSLMDQAAALKWVAANISRFGGNPKHVTIAGESAGSFAVSAQMASPMARDLIAGAIGESGAFFSTTIATPTRDSTEKLGVKFAQAVGAGNLAALRVYLIGIDSAAARRAGWTVASDPAQADVAIARLVAPFQTLHPNYVFGAMQHEGDLSFHEGDKAYDELVRVSALVPTVATVYLDRPAILTPVRDHVRALLGNFGVSDDALIDVLSGKAAPLGKLPFDLPSSMASVEAQHSDVAHDLAKPLYPFGFGRRYPSLTPATQ